MSAPQSRTLAARILRGVRSPRATLKRRLARLCEKYLNYYNGYSYNFRKNGERDLLRKVSKLDPRVVFDVGSNVGDWALISRRVFPGAEIHCFELSSRTFETLAQRLQDAHFVLNNVGLADSPGEIDYKDYGANSGLNTILLGSTYHDKVIPPRLRKGRLSTGSAYCREKEIEEIDFLKIDVEGADHLVIRGFSEMLDRQAIRIIQFEYGYVHGDAKFLMRDFFDLFEGYGYVVGRVRRGPIRFAEWTYRDNDFKSGPNYVAVRKADEQLLALLST